MKQCKKCGAAIRFIKSLSGKWHICDWEGKQLATAKPGEKLVLPDGRVHYIDGEPLKKHLQKIVGYVSHWASCPEQEFFRPRKGGVCVEIQEIQKEWQEATTENSERATKPSLHLREKTNPSVS